MPKCLPTIAKDLGNVYTCLMSDHVDTILGQWARERPDLDVSPMAVLGRLSRAAHLVHLRQAETFAKRGLDAASFDVLATLRRSGVPYRLAPSELRQSAMVTSSAIAQRLNRLEHAGLIVRSPNSADGRAVDVTLSDSGLALIERALPEHVDTEHELLHALSSEQRQQLVGLLQILAAGIENAPEAL